MRSFLILDWRRLDLFIHDSVQLPSPLKRRGGSGKAHWQVHLCLECEATFIEPTRMTLEEHLLEWFVVFIEDYVRKNPLKFSGIRFLRAKDDEDNIPEKTLPSSPEVTISLKRLYRFAEL